MLSHGLDGVKRDLSDLRLRGALEFPHEHRLKVTFALVDAVSRGGGGCSGTAFVRTERVSSTNVDDLWQGNA